MLRFLDCPSLPSLPLGWSFPFRTVPRGCDLLRVESRCARARPKYLHPGISRVIVRRLTCLSAVPHYKDAGYCSWHVLREYISRIQSVLILPNSTNFSLDCYQPESLYLWLLGTLVFCTSSTLMLTATKESKRTSSIRTRASLYWSRATHNRNCQRCILDLFLEIWERLSAFTFLAPPGLQPWPGLACLQPRVASEHILRRQPQHPLHV